ncbi:hypothetical protein WCD74_27645 [Actinomycetospora sp. OC33-EN08]|uniref:Uncharacterized protein n=1 Tax=Actinomycetospora aurantiaca TaxID=3129233 RepID=A0ABU8MW74_9PSEU
MFGPIVWSILAAVVALVVLALLVVGLLRTVNRTTTVLGAFTALLSDRVGLLRARAAAVGVRLARRPPDGPSPVESAARTEGAPS